MIEEQNNDVEAGAEEFLLEMDTAGDTRPAIEPPADDEIAVPAATQGAAGQATVEEEPFEEELIEEATTGVWPVDRLKPVLEALVFASGDPLTIKKMVDFVEGSTADEVKATLAELSTDYLTNGIRLLEVAGGWQMRTAPEHQRYVRKLFREKPQKLTRAATETVAIIAYKQPVTRQEIETVRGVDSGGVLESLVERRLAKVVGRKDVPGRPLVYATTQEFLELFGLKNIRELPTLPELGQDFERMSDQGGFNESESAAILPLEEQHGAQDDAGQTGGEGDEGSGTQGGDENLEGEARQAPPDEGNENGSQDDSEGDDREGNSEGHSEIHEPKHDSGAGVG